MTLAAYPLVPRDQVGFRVQLTAVNSDEEIDELLDAVTELADRSLLRTPSSGEALPPDRRPPRTPASPAAAEAALSGRAS